MCASYYASLSCLFYALVIKAVEMSRYGILNVGDEDWIKRAVETKEAMMNGGSNNYDSKRVSNTENLMKYKDDLISQSFDMLDQMKSILIKLGPAYDVLSKLARSPVALRRVEGFSWKDIEDDIAVHMRDSDYVEFKMNEIIDMRYINECHSVEEWIKSVSEIVNELNKEPEGLELTERDIREYVENKTKNGELIWSSTIGAMIPY
jgi:hypothetical protein